MRIIVLAALFSCGLIGGALAQCGFTLPPEDYASKTSGSLNWTTSTDWLTASGNNPSNSYSSSADPFVLHATFSASSAGYSCNTYCSCTNCYVIPPGVKVLISANMQLNANLLVYGTLIVEGKMSIGTGTPTYTAYFDDSGKICCNTCSGASDKLIINGNVGNPIAWGGSNPGTGPIVGPVTSTGGTLPVTLTTFSAQIKEGAVDLAWATGSEINFDYFSVERSGNGKDFYQIAQVKGQGTSTEGRSYSYSDQSPIIGRSYYRLTSIDFDNYQETFKVVSVEYQGEKTFHVSPNPADGTSLKVNFNFENDSDAIVTIYDNLGSVVGTFPVKGSGTISFDTSLKNGIYLAKYSSASFTKTERFLVK